MPKIEIFDFRLGFLRSIRASVPNFVNLGQKLRSSEKKWSFYTHPVPPWEQCINIWKQHISYLHIKFKIGKWLKFIGVIHILKIWTLKNILHILWNPYFFSSAVLDIFVFVITKFRKKKNHQIPQTLSFSKHFLKWKSVKDLRRYSILKLRGAKKKHPVNVGLWVGVSVHNLLIKRK